MARGAEDRSEIDEQVSQVATAKRRGELNVLLAEDMSLSGAEEIQEASQFE